MHISRGFDGGIHAIGTLVIYKYIYQNTTSIERVMDNNHDDDRKSNDHPTRKEKFYAIHQEIAKLIAEEQIAAATDGTSILNAVTECKRESYDC